MADKIFDFIAKDSKQGQIKHKFIKAATLKRAIEEHDVDLKKYGVSEITLDRFIEISEKYDEYFSRETISPSERKRSLEDYQGVLLLTNVDY
ncbi:hypothetical protein [Lactobacillus phage Maenad]|uniref:Uncharacterized protein n=1 Tax=Lactobacillus phage Maenad TaxID=2079431 RepID=A0A2P0ZKT6_9CAUD|nr:hypothetical protein HOS85_gp029 [Lactobacillus phage Maenad]AVH85603.1 hypothetical protein [Lactobacillus phage Maenad]